jgi:hypothetical protein
MEVIMSSTQKEIVSDIELRILNQGGQDEMTLEERDTYPKVLLFTSVNNPSNDEVKKHAGICNEQVTACINKVTSTLVALPSVEQSTRMYGDTKNRRPKCTIL